MGKPLLGWIVLFLLATGTAEAATESVKACEKYTKLAVEQYTQSKKLICGFQVNRWHATGQIHNEWCLKATPAARNRETDERRNALDACNTAPTKNPLDGRIVRVVYEIIHSNSGPRGSSWGFHLAQIKDGRYCVRFGNPGQHGWTRAIIEKFADICFDTIPGA